MAKPLPPSDPDATFNTANDATGGGTFNYDFDTVNDVDVFSFTLQPGETVQLETTSGPDTQLGLFNKNGKLIAFDDDGSLLGGNLSYIEYTYTGHSAATFYVAASTYDNDVAHGGGPYAPHYSGGGS